MMAFWIATATLTAPPFPGGIRSPVQRSGPGPRLSPGKADTAIEAERAFAADAQRIGQWAAFRKWAAADATMFTPQPTRAQVWLKDRKEPANAVEWWPTASWVSCDGKLAVNTGGSRWPDARVGYFTTVWHREPDGQWRWLMDRGGDLPAPVKLIDKPAVARASCRGKGWIDWGSHVDQQLYFSPDRSIIAGWDDSGASSFFLKVWNGRRYRFLEGKAVMPRQ